MYVMHAIYPFNFTNFRFDIDFICYANAIEIEKNTRVLHEHDIRKTSI